jgi:hypothetical protein
VHNGKGYERITQFGCGTKQLKIDIIFANSSLAKSRAEREEVVL